MNGPTRRRRLLRTVWRCVSIFAAVAFVTTCCMALFVSTLADSMGLTLTAENLNVAAKLTFGNVLLLSGLFTLIDALRRQLAVERPIRRLEKATQRLMRGDFSVRIPKRRTVFGDNEFAQVADCFNRLAQELQGVETLRTDFVANVSHEMKTPLAVIQNYGTLLQAPELPDDKRREYAHGMAEAARRLNSMVTNMLRLNQLENQTMYPQADTFDLGEQLCEVLLAFEPVWEQAGITPVAELADGVQVTTDRELLALVWNNLLSNAFKFTPAGGTVTVRLTVQDGAAVVQIGDTGCGMSAEVGAHIFEKFYQGDPSHAAQGNGLGLALVKRVMDILRGDMAVESTVGEGTVFTVTLRGAVT